MNTTRQPQQPPPHDDYGQIAPESARPATLTPEQPVKAPGQDGDLLLTRGTPVEVEWPHGSRSSVYVDEGGYQITAGCVGNGKPYSWGVARIVRVLTEDKPTQEPVLPRRIKPEDVRVGMVVERRKGDAAVRDRAQQINDDLITGTGWPWLWMPGHADIGWSLWLIEDAPEPVDPDAEATDADTEDVVYLSGPMTGLPDFKRAEQLERWYADALTMLDKSRKWKSIASLTAERDSLAARLALFEALAEAEVTRLTAERDAAVERLERVIDQWRETGRAVISEMNRADKAEAERDALAGLLAEFVDSEPCSLDHHGYCQSHGHLDEGECHMARARAALAGSEADTTDTQPADQEGQ